MAQKHLAQDLTTSKVQSLPKELRDIAESLIGDKFGYEEVEQYSSNHFSRNVYTISGEGISATDYTAYITNPTFVRQAGNSQIVERFNIETKRSILSTPIKSPDTRGFRDAIQRLDIVNTRRDGREAYLPKEFATKLFCTLNYPYPIYQNMDIGLTCGRSKGYYIGQLFGVKVFVSSDRKYPEIEAYR